MKAKRNFIVSLLSVVIAGCTAASPPKKPERYFKVRSNPSGVYIHVPEESRRGTTYARIGATPLSILLSGPIRIAATHEGRIMWLDIDPATLELLEFEFTESASRRPTPMEELQLKIPPASPPKKNADGLYSDQRQVQIQSDPGLSIHILRGSFGRKQEMMKAGVTPCHVVLNVRHGNQDAFALKEGKILLFKLSPDTPTVTLDFSTARQATADEMAIAENKVRIGMASAAVMKSWGEPTRAR